MPETTPLIKAALNLRVGAGFDVYFQTWLHLCYYIADYILHKSISYLICPFLNFLKVLKAFQSVLPAIFISCYNLLLDFLSLNFALVSIRNMREKDITQGKA